MTNHTALFEPLFPTNTEDIVRTYVRTDTGLHLIKPSGFSTNDKHMKRVGLDYWGRVKIMCHEDLPSFMRTIPGVNRLCIVSRFIAHDYSDVDYTGEGDHYFLFRKETTGLPKRFMQKCPENVIQIPQNDSNIQTLNLSNSTAIVIYEVLR